MNTLDAEKLRSKLNTEHLGREWGVACKVLAAWGGTTQRHIRELVTELRMGGVPVCGTPTTGYLIARTWEEVIETCKYLRSRSMHGLVLEARLRNVSLPSLLGQVEMELREAPNG